MKRATIALDDELVQELDQQASERGVSRAELVRELLRERLNLPCKDVRDGKGAGYPDQASAVAALDKAIGQKPRRPLPFAGKYASDGTVGGADIEEYLAKMFEDGPSRSR